MCRIFSPPWPATICWSSSHNPLGGLYSILRRDGAPVSSAALLLGARASAFRAPDGLHAWQDGRIGIVQLQHLTSPDTPPDPLPHRSADGRLWIALDGRIDNRDELFRALSHFAPTLRADADPAEFILAAYERWDLSTADHLAGDFAFVLWDAPAGRLFAARDSSGVRPLCYFVDATQVRVASDPRQILADGQVERTLDGEYIVDFLTLNFRHQARTMYDQVQNLLPGHALVVDAQGVRAWRYWRPDTLPPLRLPDRNSYAEAFRALLFRAVADRLPSRGRAVAVMTSGGVDSSTVAAVAHELYETGRSAVPVIAYHESFERLKDGDERAYARLLATERGVDLQEVDAEAFSIWDGEQAERVAEDSPVMSYETLTRHLFERAQEAGAQVWMTGFGGDTLFDGALLDYYDQARRGRLWRLVPWMRAGHEAGRPWSRLAARYLLWPLLPPLVQRGIDRRRATASQRFWHEPPWLAPRLRRRLRESRRSQRRGYPHRFASRARQRQYEDLIGLAQQGPSLEWFGRVAPSYGLEPRYPLLDRRLAEFVLRAPLDLGARPGPAGSKWLLREAVRGTLPEGIRQRPTKGGWGQYLLRELTADEGRSLRRLLSSSRLAAHGILEQNMIDNEIDALVEGRSRVSPTLFAPLLFLEQWFQRYTPAGAEIRFRPLELWQVE